MAMKKSVWDMILKVVIAVASALAGVLGANAMLSLIHISEPTRKLSSSPSIDHDCVKWKDSANSFCID